MEEDYIHRIGRTARQGAYGEAVSFVTPEDHNNWEFLARKYDIKGVELAVNAKRNASGNFRKELTYQSRQRRIIRCPSRNARISFAV